MRRNESVTQTRDPIVELNGIAKQFGGVQALRGVDFSLFPGEVHALVGENVFMGRHPRDRFGRVDWKRMYREVDQLLTSLDVSLSSHAPVQGLSVAEQQLVEIAKALSLQASVLVLDEPTAALSGHEVDELFAIVKQPRERGVAILFVSHRLEEVFMIADRLTVFRDGAHIITARSAR